MKEFDEYDQVVARYHQSIVNEVLPLSSWEFYGEYISFLNTCKYDIDRLSKLTATWDFDHNVQNQLIKQKSVIVVTNPNLKIIYATQNIKKMNGYTPEEVVGNSPKMFQGKDTCLETSNAIRKAVDMQTPFEYSILNYKKDKSTYICAIKGFPVYNKRGKLVNYIAFEKAA
ncbi:PAS domain-containing protein [Aquimarina addita]|uniref:PAS domain-containing protein n=1 Tax=Aquimarina addita TaxID=870485 RepID=A0ABP7X8D2_9FLAO